MEYYERIKALRLKAGETQTQAAEAVGMTLRQFQRYEAGEQKPGFDYFYASYIRPQIEAGDRTGYELPFSLMTDLLDPDRPGRPF